jgi:hypothetical protein
VKSGVLDFPPVEIGRPQVSAHWCLTRDGDLQALAIYRRHYTCRDPERDRRCFVGNGEKLVLISTDGKALFTWIKQQNRMDGQEGVNCSVFRNEGMVRSSLLIREASRLAWGKWPGERLFTFVNEEKTRKHRGRRNPPGYCFLCAGWTLLDERTKTNGLVILEAQEPD